jgi:predicted ester cyclase
MGQTASFRAKEYPMSEELKARLGRDLDRVWNQGDPNAIDELFAADVVIHNAAPGTPAGIEGVRFTVNGFRAAVPDLQFSVEKLTVDGDLVAYQWSETGTPQVELPGIPATGAKITMGGLGMVRFADGKIVEIWTAMFSPS